MEPARQIGANIRSIREDKGLSQEALAHRSEIHPVQMGRVERGVHDVKASTIVKIAQGLEVPAGRLLSGL